MRLAQWIDEARDDMTFAVRQLKGSVAFTLVAAITLAVGIGANSAMFAVADAALLRPLPYVGQDQLVALSEARDGRSGVRVNPFEFLDWSERNRTFESMAGWVQSGSRAVRREDGIAEEISSQAVTVRFFDVLRIEPVAGRFFQETDTIAPNVVVLGEGFSRSRFAGQPPLGREITMDGELFTVIGIVPEDFRFSSGRDRPRLWTLLSDAARPSARSDPAQRYAHYVNVIGRLRSGVTLAAARADMSAVAAGIAREFSETSKGHGVAIEPLREMLMGGDLRLTSMLLLGVVGFVLLMCCANVANLLLARATSRARELAVRSALGAGPRRIVRQLLTESLVLAALGGAMGVGIGATILQAAAALIPQGLLPSSIPLSFDARVLAFCALTAIGVAIAFGLIPAWQATGTPPGQALTMGGRTATTRGAGVRQLLVAGEVAVAVLLLCGAGLLLRTWFALGEVDPGHQARNALTMIVSPGMSNDAAAMRRFYNMVEREVRGVSGVRNVAWGSSLPLAGLWYIQSFQIEGDPPRSPADRDGAGYQIVSASYFDVLGIPVLRGRSFTARDTPDAVQVCIVDEAFVRQYLRGRDPLRTRLSVNAMALPAQAVVREIVGVARQVKRQPNEPDGQPHVYVPLAQNAWWTASLVVEPVGGAAAALTPAVRAAVARVNPDRAVSSVRTLEDIAWEATAMPRFRAVLVGAFAALALLLAMIGVFGVLAYSVQQRGREFGVRMALGASAGAVVRTVAGDAARVIASGAALGLVAAVTLGQLISSFLFGVEPLDAVTYLVVVLVIGVTAIAATAAPALRATRVDPAVAFRNE
jgi:putative ABC transport system permease protein